MLCVDGQPVITVVMATVWWKRMRGVLGQSSLDSAYWLEPANAVHTIGVKMSLDILYCKYVNHSGGGEPVNRSQHGVPNVVAPHVVVDDYEMLVPNRIGRSRPNCRVVVELEAGLRQHYEITTGTTLSIYTPPKLGT